MQFRCEPTTAFSRGTTRLVDSVWRVLCETVSRRMRCSSHGKKYIVRIFKRLCRSTRSGVAAQEHLAAQPLGYKRHGRSDMQRAALPLAAKPLDGKRHCRSNIIRSERLRRYRQRWSGNAAYIRAVAPLDDDDDNGIDDDGHYYVFELRLTALHSRYYKARPCRNSTLIFTQVSPRPLYTTR